MSCQCAHGDKSHCPGGVSHDGYKFTMRMVRDPHPHICPSRHCLEPLCDCVSQPGNDEADTAASN